MIRLHPGRVGAQPVGVSRIASYQFTRQGGCRQATGNHETFAKSREITLAAGCQPVRLAQQRAQRMLRIETPEVGQPQFQRIRPGSIHALTHASNCSYSFSHSPSNVSFSPRNSAWRWPRRIISEVGPL